ncbi:MAG TPA: phytanoyl-CoA dioxygenase family protein [Planctomycetota bacterium]|nr:phytanoyl-CoA dioxygenase family protein [Planctomycetota bacterium]
MPTPADHAPAPSSAFDARGRDALEPPDVALFRDNGLLVLRGVLAPAELAALRDETGRLVERAAASRIEDGDHRYQRLAEGADPVPCRIEYVVDKSTACLALLSHPTLLRAVEAIQGTDFIPTWDAMVFKQRGGGPVVGWHRDIAGYAHVSGAPQVFNVDIYLDDAGLDTCVWGIPGTNRWSAERARAESDRRNALGFPTEGAVPLPMRAGDVLIHDVDVLHGSPASRSALRRVVYYEYRPAWCEREYGPHRSDYVPLKQRVLLASQRARERMPYARGERPYRYAAASLIGEEPLLTSYRIPHDDHWRHAPG